MSKFNVDFSEAKEFIICEPGEQDFKITKAELADYKKDGETRQKIELTCEVVTGESAGAKVYHSLFLKNPTGMFMFLNKIGVKVEKQNYNLDTNVFVGKTFTANVDHEIYSKSDGTKSTKSVIVDTTIRKYNGATNINQAPDDVSEDPFADFGDSVSIDDNFID